MRQFIVLIGYSELFNILILHSCEICCLVAVPNENELHWIATNSDRIRYGDEPSIDGTDFLDGAQSPSVWFVPVFRYPVLCDSMGRWQGIVVCGGHEVTRSYNHWLSFKTFNCFFSSVCHSAVEFEACTHVFATREVLYKWLKVGQSSIVSYKLTSVLLIRITFWS